jgi:hypothetical protein
MSNSPTSSLPLLHSSPSFHAQHSAPGAFFSFTLGLAASRGGIAAELGRPASQELFIGVKDGTIHAPGVAEVLPFHVSAKEDVSANYVGTPPPEDPNQKLDLKNFAASAWSRRYGWATDVFEVASAGLSMKVYTPWDAIPDPAVASASEMRKALLPAVRTELTLDNSKGKGTRTFFFSIRFDAAGARPIATGLGAGRVGFAFKRSLGFAADLVGGGVIHPLQRWTVTNALADKSNPVHMLGNNPGVAVEVPAGQTRTLRLALGCYLDGIVTTGIEGKYFYTRYYSSLEDVLASALDPADFDAAKARSAELDARLLNSGLNRHQQFLIAHSTRSYHGSTQLLDVGGEPFWIVNEGEYCMLNTLDLSVDHVFWELRHNPWVVKNLLNNFVHHYSYVDTVGARGEPKTRPGGLSFCHDMGINNNFSPRGWSSYELKDLDALCFSHMTAEQLCNWLLIAASYVKHTNDIAWAKEYRHVIDACGESLLNRCGEGGVISFDSSRCGTGAEITTYDSLDHSLAQTRNNLYMATKSWASFLAIRELMMAADQGTDTTEADYDNWLRYAHTAGETIRRQAGPDGIIPAVFEKDNSGYTSRILPAIEGLVYPLVWKSDAVAEHGKFESLLEALKRHTLACLKDGKNHFPDGGIRLSSTSGNSWLSKIFLFQQVAVRLGWVKKEDFANADAAHVKWLTTGESAYWAMSDQIVDGVAKGSKYYPRCVTSVLWLE